MFSMNDKVIILKNGIAGTVVDVSTDGNAVQYIVESDIPNISGGYGGKWALFDCRAEDLIRGEQ